MLHAMSTNLSPNSQSDPSTSPLEIRACGITKAFQDRPVLKGIDLNIPQASMTAIVGSSGCGKTVLLDIIAALMDPDAGTVCARDHEQPDQPMVNLHTLDRQGLDRLRRHWALVFQRNALFSGTVYDNIALWLREYAGLSEQQILQLARTSLTRAALDPDAVLYRDRDELSGGMAKRVAIARAISMRPRVIFYDEPTTGLDPVVAGKIHELVFDVHHSTIDGFARTSLVITHDRDLLRRLRPRIVMINAGRVYFDGSYERFESWNDPLALAYLQQMPVLHSRQTPS